MVTRWVEHRRMTGLCIVRIEPQESGRVLISVVTDPDVASPRTVRTRTQVADVAEAVRLTKDFLESFRVDGRR